MDWEGSCEDPAAEEGSRVLTQSINEAGKRGGAAASPDAWARLRNASALSLHGIEAFQPSLNAIHAEWPPSGLRGLCQITSTRELPAPQREIGRPGGSLSRKTRPRLPPLRFQTKFAELAKASSKSCAHSALHSRQFCKKIQFNCRTRRRKPCACRSLMGFPTIIGGRIC